jgi:hypothetical protein
MTGKAPQYIESLAAKLRVMAAGRDALDVARLQFVDLEEIRGAYGDRWPSQKARIHDIAESYLQKRIGADDILIAAGGGFLIIYGSAESAATDAATGAITHGLNEFFLGEVGETPAPQFGATKVAMPVKELAESLGEVDFIKGPPPIQAPNLPTVDWRYQPVWDVRRETLASWYLTPYSRHDSVRLPGYHFESVVISPAQYCLIDEASLQVSEQTLKELIPLGRQVMIGASIHVSTMVNLGTRAKILSAIDKLDAGFFRYRVLKIAGVTPGFPRLYLNEIVSLLRARMNNVVISGAWDEGDIPGLLEAGPVAVGVTLPRSVVGPSPTVPIDNLIRKIAQDAQAVHNARMRFFVDGQIERSLAIRLVTAGADNIASPRIWPAGGAPTGMLKWPSSQLAAA